MILVGRSSLALLSLLCFSLFIFAGCDAETGTAVTPPPTAASPLGGDGTKIMPGQEDDFKKAMEKNNN